MPQQPTQSARMIPQTNPMWRAVFVAIAVIAALFAGAYWDRAPPVTPQMRLQYAVQQLRDGYDQTANPMLKPLADEGNPKAQYWLLDIYENGLGVPADKATSVALLEKSAAQGFEPAERHFGGLYLRRNETLQDFGKAQKWLRAAAIAGDGDAQRELGQMFALGPGVPRSLPEAYAWYENASLSGDGLAKHLRGDILTRMSPADIATGEQRAREIAAETKPHTH
jgi:TPR repeat protein